MGGFRFQGHGLRVRTNFRRGVTHVRNLYRGRDSSLHLGPCCHCQLVGDGILGMYVLDL